MSLGTLNDVVSDNEKDLVIRQFLYNVTLAFWVGCRGEEDNYGVSRDWVL